MVNNTGGPKAGYFDELDDSDWVKTFESTFLSAVRVTRKVIPSMKKNQWGRITNISSISAKQPIDNLILSNGVRMSVHGWSKTLSNQLAEHNILINNVCPGFTHTERVDGLIKYQAEASKKTEEEIVDSIASNIPAKRVGKAEELAALVAFLSSEKSSYITGQSIAVDGGVSGLPI
ncbi:MAG TPA: SDR family oxidoreductase [Flavobacteriales bacterium]|nr:SDR family oxidoreductase [Flavobacteriales bacterium]